RKDRKSLASNRGWHLRGERVFGQADSKGATRSGAIRGNARQRATARTGVARSVRRFRRAPMDLDIVDAYYGPPDLAERVMLEQPMAPAEIAREATALRNALTALDDPQRARWLSAQLDGVAASAERLDVQPITYIEEIRRCYGIVPEPATEGELADAHLEL